MNGSFAGDKKIELTIPENMSEETASRCFMMGMHTFLKINNGGIVISYGIEDNENEIVLQAMDFKDDYAVAVRKFCEAIRIIANRKENKEKNLESFRDDGTKILKDLENGNK